MVHPTVVHKVGKQETLTESAVSLKVPKSSTSTSFFFQSSATRPHPTSRKVRKVESFPGAHLKISHLLGEKRRMEWSVPLSQKLVYILIPTDTDKFFPKTLHLTLRSVNLNAHFPIRQDTLNLKIKYSL